MESGSLGDRLLAVPIMESGSLGDRLLAVPIMESGSLGDRLLAMGNGEAENPASPPVLLVLLEGGRT